MAARTLACVAILALALAVDASNICASLDASLTVGDRRTNAGSARLRVGAFNARWLFDGVSDVSASPYANGEANAAREHGRMVSEVIRAIDADVVVLTETETCETLDWAREGTPNVARALVKGTDTATQQQIGILSKISFVEEPWRREDRADYNAATSACGYSGSKNSGVSKHAVARFKVGARTVALIGAHLKANPTQSSSCAQREAQAEVLRSIARERFEAGDAVIVAGDLNDYSDLHVDAGNNSPTSRVLRMLRDLNNDGVDELQEVGELVAVSDRYTWRSGSSKAKLDYILVSRSDFDLVSASIQHDLVNASVSDHFPLLAIVDVLTTRDTSRLLASMANATSASATLYIAALTAVLTIYLVK